MKILKIKLGLFSLVITLIVSIFFTACEQDTIKTIDADYQEFEIKETYTIYAPEDAFSLEELINMETSNARQNFVDNLNSNYEVETQAEVDSRYCGSWSSWYSSYPCEYVRWRYCGSSYARPVPQYEFICVCAAQPAC